MVAVALARPAALAFYAMIAAASPALAQSSPPTGSVVRAGSIEGNILIYVTRARLLAIQKLRATGCRRIFGEFEDLEGHRLDDVLAAWGETAEERLRQLAFRDGSNSPGCERPGVFASTTPGSLTIFVCPAFRLMAKQEPRTAANILIHEELHSLGVGEAPMPGLPSSEDITTRVERRCGR